VMACKKHILSHVKILVLLSKRTCKPNLEKRKIYNLLVNEFAGQKNLNLYYKHISSKESPPKRNLITLSDYAPNIVKMLGGIIQKKYKLSPFSVDL
jgi:hypothetical protein